ncbi:hypothetical protein [Peribacillus frigoritolerans]|uniref:hypothetical protein n=1 Tax=Peribacillus castrilensis TaxID=2897690 RepID=UPI003DA3F1C8
MKKNRWVFLLMILMIFGGSSQAYADVHVNGYFRKNGTYVQPHYRSDPDGVVFNNFSTFGNFNPYTGKLGTKRSEYNNFSPYSNSYNPFTYRYPGNDYANLNYYGESNIDDEPIITDSLEMSGVMDTTSTEVINTVPSEPSENINVTERYKTPSDTTDEVAAKDMIVEYFNNVNTRNYMSAYDFWGTDWQSQHPYQAFKDGYVDVVNHIDDIYATSNENGITLEVNLTAEEGWEQIEHRYHIVYNVQKVEDQWKMIHGKGKRVK